MQNMHSSPLSHLQILKSCFVVVFKGRESGAKVKPARKQMQENINREVSRERPGTSLLGQCPQAAEVSPSFCPMPILLAFLHSEKCIMEEWGREIFIMAKTEHQGGENKEKEIWVPSALTHWGKARKGVVWNFLLAPSPGLYFFA